MYISFNVYHHVTLTLTIINSHERAERERDSDIYILRFFPCQMAFQSNIISSSIIYFYKHILVKYFTVFSIRYHHWVSLLIYYFIIYLFINCFKLHHLSFFIIYTHNNRCTINNIINLKYN